MKDEKDLTIDNFDEPNFTTTHSFFIAGVQHHQLRSCLDEMNVGDRMILVLEPTNPYDPNAVRIEYSAHDSQVMCGYVPKKFSSEVSASLVIGNKLECVIVELNPSAKPWEMCKVEIREGR